MADKKTINTYNKTALEYDAETTDFWNKFPASIFKNFQNSVKRSGFVLDAGSGPGRDGLILQKAGLNVICLDASEAMVKMTLAKKLPSVLGDLLNLPFPDQAFPGVWSYTALLHLKKAQVPQALSEINRVLVDGGVFGLGLIEGQGEGYKSDPDTVTPRWFAYYSKDELEDLLKKHGFEPFYFEEFKPGSKNYLNFLARKKKYVN